MTEAEQLQTLARCEELLVNALVHRDYFITAPIRLLVFADRVEIISPGHLPNHLDTEQIRYGQSNLRNAALASHAFHLLPYQGLGSGIPRATQEWPQIEFVDDRRGNQFKAIVRRATAQPESQPESLSLEQGVLHILQHEPGSKAELSARLGHKRVSGQLNKVIRDLLGDAAIALTIPDKPNSRLQKYRLTAQGRVQLKGRDTP